MRTHLALSFRASVATALVLLAFSAPALADEAAEGEAADDAATLVEGAAEAADDAANAEPEEGESDGSADEAAPTEEEAPAPEASTAPRTFEVYAQSNPAPSASGASAGGDSPDWRRITEAELLEPTQTFPYIETHGYFRFRADSFWNLDLDTYGTSPVLPPIEALATPGNESDFDQGIDEGSEGSDLLREYTNRGAEHLAGANVRFRLRPTFHITEKLRVHLELNFLDNTVLGSQADGQQDGFRVDVPLVGFTGGQQPSVVSVTQAYGEVNTFFGTLRLGRQASQWGLGILANGSGSHTSLREPRVSYRGLSMSGHTCMDCDYGDYVDRAMFITNVFDAYVALGWDYNFAGPTDQYLGEYYGQPRELSNYDDTRSIIVSVFQRPIRPEEIARRNRTLKELRRPTLDWGFYFVYRTQRLTSEPLEVDNINNYEWFPRGARAFIPDLWLRFQSEPAFRTRIRLELELAAIFGTIDNANPSSISEDTERDLQQLGAALEFEYVRSAMATGFNAGFATGRNLEGDCDGAVPIGFQYQDAWAPNSCEETLSNFRFDRNYFVDMIMFREIIGGITNAYYLNPFFQYDLFSKQDDNLGVRLDLITAFAANSDTTPSGESFYGVETDLTLYYREPNYGADLSAGFYFPGSAFNGVEGRPRYANVSDLTGRTGVYDSAVGANPAYTLQGRFFWAF